MADYRIKLLEQYQELIVHWNDRNMLYNSLRFYQVYGRDVENSSLIKDVIGKKEGCRNDIMTSWWKPTKYFLFRDSKGSREELTKQLLELIPAENDMDALTEALSCIRYGAESGQRISREVISSFLRFLSLVYTPGNITNAAKTTTGGALDNWDSKLMLIKDRYIAPGEWIQYVEDNCFQCFFADDRYELVNPLWNYGSRNIADATDDDWYTYFSNAGDSILLREELLGQKK